MEINIKDGYKVTEVGVIPDDWEVKKLGDISEKIMVGIASAATHAYSEKGVVLFRNQNIKYGYLDDRDILFVNDKYEEIFKNKRLKSGDLLIARTGYPGSACIIPDKYEGSQSFTTLIVRPQNQNVKSDFLCYFINCEIGQMFFEVNQIGGGQKNVNAGSLKLMPIIIPPLAEQKAIAHALSDVDNLITAIDQLITKKRNLKQGTMQELLTGKKRLPGFSGKWEVKKLGELINSLQNGYGFSARGYIRVGIPIVTMAQIGLDGSFQFDESKVNFWTSSEFESLKNYHLKYGDVIIAMTDVTPSKNLIGRMCQVNRRETFLLNQRVGLLRIDREKINPLFLVALSNLSNTKGWRDYSKSVASLGVQANISTKDILNGTIKIPTIEEQKAIAEILTDMDKEIEALEKKRDKYKTIKQGMMQELLTGKTRIIDN
ncbi:restriction endonuclease subunit S [Anabaena sp. FACHB-1250]|uniref:restriction endonuclease subunit S n=1 Tax=Anabaena sp. FACHB-1250 TaxID=2692770 RepID=UPI001680D596|nr:restriction endonuclease subunit S [Anabaena sp. FACHB-1250]MBD2143016.1 restriction endonuclease subunit S [Anabaena sp. FACHB-1250]